MIAVFPAIIPGLFASNAIFLGSNAVLLGSNVAFLGSNAVLLGSNAVFLGSNVALLGSNVALLGSNAVFLGRYAPVFLWAKIKTKVFEGRFFSFTCAKTKFDLLLLNKYQLRNIHSKLSIKNKTA
jgi:hypothetical protein